MVAVRMPALWIVNSKPTFDAAGGGIHHFSLPLTTTKKSRREHASRCCRVPRQPFSDAHLLQTIRRTRPAKGGTRTTLTRSRRDDTKSISRVKMLPFRVPQELSSGQLWKCQQSCVSEHGCFEM